MRRNSKHGFQSRSIQNVRVVLKTEVLKTMEDSRRYRAVGRIGAGQSSTNVALFLGVHRFIISRLLMEAIPNQLNSSRKTCGWSTKGLESCRNRCIAGVTKQNRRLPCTYICDIRCCTGRCKGDICLHERTIRPGTTNECSSICLIQ